MSLIFYYTALINEFAKVKVKRVKLLKMFAFDIVDIIILR